LVESLSALRRGCRARWRCLDRRQPLGHVRKEEDEDERADGRPECASHDASWVPLFGGTYTDRQRQYRRPRARQVPAVHPLATTRAEGERDRAL